MTFKPGDRVVWTRAHCQRITGGNPHCDAWHDIGTVLGPAHREGMLMVQWDNQPTALMAWSEYLTKPGTAAHLTIDDPKYVGETPGKKGRFA